MICEEIFRRNIAEWISRYRAERIFAEIINFVAMRYGPGFIPSFRYAIDRSRIR
jgi:hypothetical protein